MSGFSWLKKAFVMAASAVSAFSVAGCTQIPLKDLFRGDEGHERVLSSYLRLTEEQKKILEDSKNSGRL